MDKIKGEGGGGRGRWVWMGGVEGWGENTDNCNRITIKILKDVKKKKKNSQLLLQAKECPRPT